MKLLLRKSDMKAVDGMIDKYLKYPIILDIVVIALIWGGSGYFSLFEFVLTDRNNQLNILPYIISADVSLAGFMLAALTIIVTFKSNIKSKGMDDATNALELIFSSKHYNNIVKVFKKSLVELVLCFIILFGAWLYSDNFSVWTINKINLSGIIITTLAISRSLFVLFMVLELEKHTSTD